MAKLLGSCCQDLSGPYDLVLKARLTQVTPKMSRLPLSSAFLVPVALCPVWKNTLGHCGPRLQRPLALRAACGPFCLDLGALSRAWVHSSLSVLCVPFPSSSEWILFIYGCCVGSSLLLGVFFSCSRRELLSRCGARAFVCSGFSCCWAQALGRMGFSSCGGGLSRVGGSRALEHRLTSCGPRS